MNAKISYTVPFEKIPQKISQVLQTTDIDEIHKTLDNFYVNREYIGSTLQEIDSIRKQLATLDLLMEDCYNILAAYDAKMQGVQQRPQVVDIDEEVEKDKDV
jgi:hypothetical protein